MLNDCKLTPMFFVHNRSLILHYWTMVTVLCYSLLSYWFLPRVNTHTLIHTFTRHCTLTLGSTTSQFVPFPNTIIGCGSFDAKGSGIVGLGAGAVSLVPNLSIEGKFSYCFIPLTSQGGDTTSKLNFGSNARVSGSRTMSTLLLISAGTDYFYYLKLEAISVGSKRINSNKFFYVWRLIKGQYYHWFRHNIDNIAIRIVPQFWISSKRCNWFTNYRWPDWISNSLLPVLIR